jgi:hypothetical protein
MDNKVLLKQIKAAEACQDQMVFVYLDKTDKIVVRFVTPIEVDGDTVLCHQHLPENGFRRFYLNKIKEFKRVVSRDIFPSLDEGTKKGAPNGVPFQCPESLAE